MVSSLVARRWVGPRALWRLWRGALVGGLVPGACLWLGPPWLGLGFSLALAVCGSWALFFVSSWSVGLIGVFSMMVHCVGWVATVRAGCFLCFGSGGVWAGGFGACGVRLGPRWLGLLSVLGRWFCCCWLVVCCYSHCGSL